MKLKNSLNNWDNIINDIIDLATYDHLEALNKSKKVLPTIIKDYGISKELSCLQHQIGILSMLIGNYDDAEQFLQEAMETGEKSKIDVEDYAKITEHLAMLYEAKARIINGN